MSEREDCCVSKADVDCSCRLWSLAVARFTLRGLAVSLIVWGFFWYKVLDSMG